MLNFSCLPSPAALIRSLLATFLIFLCLPAVAQAQAPGWQSARAVATATAAATTNSSAVGAMAVDAAGNVYLAGSFTNTVVLGSTTLTSLGSEDIFIAKFNPTSHQFIWVQQAGGTGSDVASELSISGTSLYVAGYFGGTTAGFGATILTNAGGYDIFVAKLADTGSTGNFVWAQRAGGSSFDQANALSIRGTSIYVGGYFNGPTADFGATTLTNASTGFSDAFVAKLTDAGSTGSFMWARRAGSAGDDGASALSVSGTSIYVAGYFNGPTADFGPSILASAGRTDAFVAKLTDAGSFVWAQRAGGPGDDGASALTVSGASVYAAGSFSSSTVAFGPITLTNQGSSDVFVAKLADAGSTGSFGWAQRAGSVGDDNVFTLVMSGTSLYIAGTFSGSMANFGTTTLANAGFYDMFVAKLTDIGTAGSFAWAQRAGGTGYDAAGALAISGTTVYVGGGFTDPAAVFGNITLTNPYPSFTSSLGFLAALTDRTPTASATGRILAPTQLFPNPARRTVTLHLPAGTTPAPFILTDAQGRAVRHYPAPASLNTVLDVRGLTAGIYFLRGAGLVQRLVVE